MTDKLAMFAKEMKTLSNGSEIQHIGAHLPLAINKVSGLFLGCDGKIHKIDDFDWEGGRYLI